MFLTVMWSDIFRFAPMRRWYLGILGWTPGSNLSRSGVRTESSLQRSAGDRKTQAKKRKAPGTRDLSEHRQIIVGVKVHGKERLR